MQVLGTRAAEQLPAVIQQTTESVVASKNRVVNKLQAEKQSTQTLSDMCNTLLAKQRAYFSGLKEFQEECNKNENLKSLLEKAKVP